MTTISMCRHAQDNTCTDIALTDALTAIKHGQHAQLVSQVRAAYDFGGKDGAAESKKRLAGYLFSGTFTKRAASALRSHSGLICVDLDDLPNPSQTREAIESDPHCLACFLSPTGSGLKVLFRTATTDHAAAYASAEQYVATHFGLRIDQACKDVSRLCFTSHDPDLTHNEDAIPLPPAQAPQEYRAPLTQPSGTTPGDDYDRRASLPDLLIKYGWAKHGANGWTRPGRTGTISATLDKVPGRFYVFTSSTEFQANHVYRPWHVYAILEHGGDFGAAARALANQGFGEKSRQQQTFERVTGEGEAPPLIAGRAPSTFALPAPDDRSILIGNRWLSRGDIGILASTSGMGKSSLSLQMAYHWALAQPIFGGFKPNGALKILIVQAEDGDGDIAEVRHSLEHAMQLTEDQRATVDKNIVIVTDRVNRGLAFRTSLKSLIAHHHPDLVIINPLLAFMDGDVNDSKDVGSFIREQLNSLNEPASFAYLIIHHTAKPPKEKKDRQWNEVMYEMAGSADLTNAARAILSLQATETKGEFRLKAAKRGMRAGLTVRQPGTINPEIVFDQPTDEVALRHSALKMVVAGQELPVIHWEVSTAKAASQQPAGARRGRPAADPESYLRFVPIGADKALPANQIFKNTNEATGMTNRGFAKMLHRAAEDGLLTLADIPGRGPCYHL